MLSAIIFFNFSAEILMPVLDLLVAPSTWVDWEMPMAATIMTIKIAPAVTFPCLVRRLLARAVNIFRMVTIVIEMVAEVKK